MTSFPFLGPSDLLPECSLFANSQVQGQHHLCICSGCCAGWSTIELALAIVLRTLVLPHRPWWTDGSSFGAARIDIPSSHVVDRSQRHKFSCDRLAVVCKRLCRPWIAWDNKLHHYGTWDWPHQCGEIVSGVFDAVRCSKLRFAYDKIASKKQLSIKFFLVAPDLTTYCGLFF